MEFEESLSFAAPSNELMLANLDLKVDLNRFPDGNVEDSMSESSLLASFANYDYEHDKTNHCGRCEMLFGGSKSECCIKFVYSQKSGFLSDLERFYWVSFFNNPYKTIVALPNYTMMLFLQTGVPFQLLPHIWQKLILVNQANHAGIPDVSKQIFKNFQHSYNRDISNQINKDLSRTFPSVTFFQEQETIDELLTILNVYANYDLELGYCQGLLFLVGTLYFQFRQSELTFHALCKIMECEPELRNIFVPATMSSTLDKWFNEFINILSKIDAELASHLTSFCDCKVFLFQWWLSILLIHTPGLTVNNRIVDFCLMEGWKVGVFKISIGLLLKNRPILMSFSEDDEEVVYQHLLNESKWGNVINNLTSFFGDLLLSWDDHLFLEINCASVPQPVFSSRKSHKCTASSVLEMFKNFSITTSSSQSTAACTSMMGPTSASSMNSSESLARTCGNRSMLSVFSTKPDLESIYSDVISTYSCDTRSQLDFLKLPVRNASHNSILSDTDHRSLVSKSTEDDLILENQILKFYLKKAYDQLNDESLKEEIREAIDLELVA